MILSHLELFDGRSTFGTGVPWSICWIIHQYFNISPKYGQNNNHYETYYFVFTKILKEEKYKHDIAKNKKSLDVKDADMIVAFWNGSSTGTKYTINYAKMLEKEVLVLKF